MDTQSAGSQTVLIAEGNLSGHRPYYVRLIAEAALRRNSHVVLLTTPDQALRSEARTHLHGLIDRIELRESAEITVTTLEEISKELFARRTIVPDGDRLAIALGVGGHWRGHGSLSVLIMREKPQPHKFWGVQWLKGSLRSLLFRRARRLPNVRLLILGSALHRGTMPSGYVRDPIRISDVASGSICQWDLSRPLYWFGIIGAISSRKNVTMICSALAELHLPGHIGLLVAGAWDTTMDDGARQALERLRESGVEVRVVDRVLEENEFDAAISAIDCVVLAHSNEGPSGIMGRAAAIGTRVVAAGAHSLKNDLDNMPTLGQWVPLEVSALAAAFSAAVAQPRPASVIACEHDEFAEALL